MTTDHDAHVLDPSHAPTPFTADENYATWLDLQAHASFPAAQTTIEPEALDTPMGTSTCLRYTVREGATVDTFWFAKELPGMPVKSTTEQEGRLTSTVTMVRNSVGMA